MPASIAPSMATILATVPPETYRQYEIESKRRGCSVNELASLILAKKATVASSDCMQKQNRKVG